MEPPLSIPRVIWIALLVRLLPLLLWPDSPCTRDDCTYLALAHGIVAGKGMVGTHGWLWAPGYPYFLALHERLFGDASLARWTQVLISCVSVPLVGRLARPFGPRAENIARWMQALSPTQVFFAVNLWSEAVYTTALLGALVASQLPVRKRWAGLAGALVGICLLFRGMAMGILPAIGFSLDRKRFLIAILACAAAVFPYSLSASFRWGGPMLTDRTLGQMMWLGDNSFSPVTFDWGNGALSDERYHYLTADGRPHCTFEDDPARQDECEVAAGVAWISTHPVEFAGRIPLRVAQLLNPHSFLTRHLRFAYWKGMPNWLDEILILATVGFSAAGVLGGLLGWIRRGTNALGRTSAVLVVWHVLAISVLAGLTRYRVPLEPLGYVWFASLFSETERPASSTTRTILGWLVFVTATIEILWFLPSGWPAWRTW